MSNELVKNAKTGNCGSIKALINQSFISQGISVKNISIDDGILNIELRSLKGKIERSVLEGVKSNAENLSIETVEIVQVFQSHQNSSSAEIGSKSKSLSYSRKEYNKSNSENPLDWLMDEIYGDNLNIKILGVVLFILGFIMMGVGLVYDPSYGDTYNIGAISFKTTYTNTGGFISVCGAVLIASAKSKIND